MTTGAKIGLVALGLAIVGGGIALYVYTELGKEPDMDVKNINPDKKTADIIVGKKHVSYKFTPNTVLELGPVTPFYTAQVVAYSIESADEAARIDVKLMRQGKLAKTKTVYLG